MPADLEAPLMANPGIRPTVASFDGINALARSDDHADTAANKKKTRLWKTWNWSRTLSYWIAIFYLEGSFLFVLGGIFSLSKISKASEHLELGLVAMIYFIGGIAFTLGGWCGLMQIMNIRKQTDHDDAHLRRRFVWCGTPRVWRRTIAEVGCAPFVGYAAYFLGALFFQVSTTGGLIAGKPELVIKLVDWLTAVLGSACFIVGGVVEVVHNKIWLPEKRFSLIFWLALCNFMGGVFFFIAAFSGFVGTSQGWLFVDVPYLIGSLLFLAGSFLSLHMWKSEQFGMGMYTQLNKDDSTTAAAPAIVGRLHAEYGCGQAENSQMIFLFLYVICASAAACDVGLLTFQSTKYESWSGSKGGLDLLPPQWLSDMLTVVVGFCLTHGILLLGSVLHHVPRVNPHRWLLLFLRFVLVLYTLNSWIGVFRQIDTEMSWAARHPSIDGGRR